MIRSIRIVVGVLALVVLAACPLPFEFTPSDTTGATASTNDPANPSVTAQPSFVRTEITSGATATEASGGAPIVSNVNLELYFEAPTPGASYFYTLDGSDPVPGGDATERLTAGSTIVMDTDGMSATVKAIAIAPGMYPSLISERHFSVEYEQVATPTFSPSPNQGYGADFEVTLTSATAGATIWYRIVDGIGGAPDPVPGAAGTLEYDPSNKPVISGSPTSVSISAIAVMSEMKDSFVANAWYAIGYPLAASPVLSLGSSNTFASDQQLAISLPAGETDPSAALYFLDVASLGGAPIPGYPNDEWVRYDDLANRDSDSNGIPDPISITGDGTVYSVAAITVVDGKEPSPPVTATYTISWAAADTPVLSLGSADATFTSDQTLVLSVPPSETDPSATVYYLDVDDLGGSPIPDYPDAAWTEYSTPISIAGNGTSYQVAAITVVDGKQPSPVVSTTYTIDYKTLSLAISSAGGSANPYSASNGNSLDSGLTLVIPVTDPDTGIPLSGVEYFATTDGSEPNVVPGTGSSTVTVTSPGLVRVNAYAPGYVSPATSTSIEIWGRIGAPVATAITEFDPGRILEDTTTTITSPDADADIHFAATTDGSAPAAPESGSLLTSANFLFNVADVRARVRMVALPPGGSAYLVMSNEISFDYEVHPAFYVTGFTQAELRSRIASALLATSTRTPVVKLPESVSNVITVSGSPIVIDNDVIIFGNESNPDQSVISGGNTTSHFLIIGGSVEIQGVTLQNGVARGGDGERGAGGGGGGAGAGGSIFMNGSGTVLRLSNSQFLDNTAMGGNGGDRGEPVDGGGGGSDDGGRGGEGYPSAFADSPGNGGNFNDYSPGGSGQGAGFLSGGGGGGNSWCCAAGDGGDGSFGGGGGGGGHSNGGPSGNPGNDGVYAGHGGAFGGNPGGGGGGAGLGGAIFVNNGATLLAENTVFSDNAAIGGAAGPGANNGLGVGGHIYTFGGSFAPTGPNVFGGYSADIADVDGNHFD